MVVRVLSLQMVDIVKLSLIMIVQAQNMMKLPAVPADVRMVLQNGQEILLLINSNLSVGTEVIATPVI